MFRRIGTGLAAVLVVAAAALAFPFTSWSGTLACKVKVKVVKGERAKTEQEFSGIGLSTQAETFDFSNLGPGTLSGRMSMRNAKNYKTFHFEPGAEFDAFSAWVKAKVLMATGIDVDLDEATLKGHFVLLKGFT